MRIQMPMTRGASGAPIIDDADKAVGINSEVPIIIAGDVRRLANVTGLANTVSSGTTLSGFDLPVIVGHLATAMIEFESPGAAFAVPTSYLLPPK